MNKNLGLLVGLSGVIIMLALFGIEKAIALCTQDMLDDWPDIPCDPVQFSPEKLREHWQGYYKFKGQEWMEEKSAEMEKAILSGKLEEWRSSISNYNVWVYYKITNNAAEVPPLKQFKSENNITTNYVDFQALQASQAKCTILGLSGKEACNMQSFLTLKILASAVIGTVIAISIISLKRSNQNNL